MAKNNTLQRITQSAGIKAVRLLDRLSRWLPGFEKISLSDSLMFFFKALRNGAINMRAAAVTYHFILALFPALIFLFSTLAFIPIPDFQDTLLALFQRMVPPNIWPYVGETIVDLLLIERGGLLSLGVLLTLFFSMNGVSGIMSAFNQSAQRPEKRKWHHQKLIALLLVIVLSATVIVTVGLLSFSASFGEKLVEKGIIEGKNILTLLMIFRWIVLVFFLFMIISVLYYFGPSSKYKFRFFSPGASVATLLSIPASLLFKYYLTNFSNYNSVYGSLGTLIILMLWIHFHAQILIIGYELNLSLKRNTVLDEKDSA